MNHTKTPDSYIIRCVASHRVSGDVEHSFYYGPYSDRSVAEDAAETLEDNYRALHYRVDGIAMHTECYVERLMPCPILTGHANCDQEPDEHAARMDAQ